MYTNSLAASPCRDGVGGISNDLVQQLPGQPAHAVHRHCPCRGAAALCLLLQLGIPEACHQQQLLDGGLEGGVAGGMCLGGPLGAGVGIPQQPAWVAAAVSGVVCTLQGGGRATSRQRVQQQVALTLPQQALCLCLCMCKWWAVAMGVLLRACWQALPAQPTQMH